MTTYTQLIDELREKIDLIINENEEICLSSPMLVEKALEIEKKITLIS